MTTFTLRDKEGGFLAHVWGEHLEIPRYEGGCFYIYDEHGTLIAGINGFAIQVCADGDREVRPGGRDVEISDFLEVA